MAPYVPATSQLVVEIFVRDMARARAFYEGLGVALRADHGTFVELSREDHYRYRDQRADLPPITAQPQANMRVMVPDVDRHWARVWDESWVVSRES